VAFFSDAVYVIPFSKRGYSWTVVPYGCISDMVTPGTHYLYWNPFGVAKSLDPRLQPVCKSPTSINIPGNCPSKLRISHA
jgi:hypothetical protein